MKFSYTLLKQFLPKLKNKESVIDALSMYSFEAEEAEGNTIEISLPPNRYSDAVSHVGVARELAASFKLKLDKRGIKDLPYGAPNTKPKKGTKLFTVTVKDKKVCPRYSAQYFENIKIGPSPKWMQDVLNECGLRPINNVVDIMNYVMLETGQPLHAFDYDKLVKKGKAKLIVRYASPNESLVSIDGIKYELTQDMLVIADGEKPLVIAGIKGGTGCEVTEHTKRIIVESANFDFVSILKTSRKLGLLTDASQRFSHNLSTALVEIGLNRAEDALVKIVKAKAGERSDSQIKLPSKRLVKFSVESCNKLIGISLTEKQASTYLQELGFKNLKKNLWEVPKTRNDIETEEDVTEEIVRMYGYANVRPMAPKALLLPPETNDAVILRELLRNKLVGLGFNEVYNHSFISNDDIIESQLWRENAISLANPTSAEFEYLRPTLMPSLLKNVEANSRYFEKVRLFEIGNTFLNVDGVARETSKLGLVMSEKGSGTFFELKGIVMSVLKGAGLSDFYMKEVHSKDNPLFIGGYLELKSGNIKIGYLGVSRERVSVAEIDLTALLPLVQGEHEFKPLQKYPTVMRDISMFVPIDVRIGELIKTIQEENTKLISDVDLVDEYIDDKWADIQSVTLRVMFEAKDRTLTSEEVDGEMKKIASVLEKEFGAKLR